MYAQIVEENEVCRLLEDQYNYITEDKTRLDMPIIHRGTTETLINITIEFAKDEGGKLLPVRAYYPKRQFDLCTAKKSFEALTRLRRRPEYG